MNGLGPRTDPAPLFSVVRGSPTDEELAALVVALVVVLSARTSHLPGSPSRKPTSGWSAYRHSVRTPLHPGPGAWRMSGRD